MSTIDIFVKDLVKETESKETVLLTYLTTILSSEPSDDKMIIEGIWRVISAFSSMNISDINEYIVYEYAEKTLASDAPLPVRNMCLLLAQKKIYMEEDHYKISVVKEVISKILRDFLSYLDNLPIVINAMDLMSGKPIVNNLPLRVYILDKNYVLSDTISRTMIRDMLASSRTTILPMSSSLGIRGVSKKKTFVLELGLHKLMHRYVIASKLFEDGVDLVCFSDIILRHRNSKVFFRHVSWPSDYIAGNFVGDGYSTSRVGGFGKMVIKKRSNEYISLDSVSVDDILFDEWYFVDADGIPLK